MWLDRFRLHTTKTNIPLWVPVSHMDNTDTTVLSALLPDHTPSRVDLFIMVLAAFELYLNFYTESSGREWQWVVAGFISCVLIAGPIAKTSVGRLLGEWFREIGIAGRALLIVLFAIGWYLVASTFYIPLGTVTSVSNGAFLWVLLFVPVQYIYTTRFREN